MDPLIGEGLIGAAGSLFSGIFGSSGQKATNKTNLQIARETNKANRENQEYQNEWNLQMWNKQNEYNNPAAQRSRLEAAGLNPITNGLDGTGNAGSLTSAEYTATPGAPMENSGAFMADGLMNAARQYAEIKNIEANTKETEEKTVGQQIYNQIQSATAGTQISIAGAQLEVTQEMKNNLVQNQTESVARINQMEQQIRQVDEQITLARQQYDLEKWKAEVDKQLRESQLNQEQQQFMQRMALDWYLAKLQGKLVDLSILNGVVDRENTRADTGLKRSQSHLNDIDAKTRHYINEGQQSLLWNQSNKMYKEARFGSGIVGDVLNGCYEIGQSLQRITR